MWNNQGYSNQNYPQYYGQPNYSQQSNFQPNNNSWPKQPPIAFKANINLNCKHIFYLEITSKSQKLVATQKEHLSKIKTKHTTTLPVLQQLDVTKKAL